MQSAQPRQLAPHTHFCPLPQPPSAVHWGTHTGALVCRYTQLESDVVQGQDGPSEQAANAKRSQSHRIGPF